MGRTVPSATQVFMQEEQNFARFRRALRRADQLALDNLFIYARQHVAEIQYAANTLPFETILMAMLLEEHKELMRLKGRIVELEGRQRIPESQLEVIGYD